VLEHGTCYVPGHSPEVTIAYGATNWDPNPLDPDNSWVPVTGVFFRKTG